MGTAVNLFSLKNYYKIVVPYRAKTICRKFKTCFLKKAPNVKYSWGISGILNQNSVNSEFVNGRPRISRPPFFAFFMWDYFPLQGNITILANITPKKFYLFVVILFISSIDISFNSLMVCNKRRISILDIFHRRIKFYRNIVISGIFYDKRPSAMIGQIVNVL